MIAGLIHLFEIIGSQALGGDDRPPPLIADHWHSHHLKEFQWHIGLDDGVGFVALEDIAAQISEPGLLEFGCCRCALQLPLGHSRYLFKSPINSSIRWCASAGRSPAEASSRMTRCGMPRAFTRSRIRG